MLHNETRMFLDIMHNLHIFTIKINKKLYILNKNLYSNLCRHIL